MNTFIKDFLTEYLKCENAEHADVMITHIEYMSNKNKQLEERIKELESQCTSREDIPLL